VGQTKTDICYFRSWIPPHPGTAILGSPVTAPMTHKPLQAPTHGKNAFYACSALGYDVLSFNICYFRERGLNETIYPPRSLILSSYSLPICLSADLHFRLLPTKNDRSAWVAVPIGIGGMIYVR
jgi:hypothetical protein